MGTTRRGNTAKIQDRDFQKLARHLDHLPCCLGLGAVGNAHPTILINLKAKQQQNSLIL